jgi:hypothetical protein
LVINSGDTVKWSWSAPNLVTGVSFQVVQVEDAASTAPIGFSSGNSTTTGRPKSIVWLKCISLTRN